MSYALEDLAAQLREAREKQGFSQRELSALAGVPQSHISKIESGNVDLRLSSLAAIANTLDLELILAPRKTVPAVRSIVRGTFDGSIISPDVRREFDRLAESLRNAAKVAHSPAVKNLSNRLRELQVFQPQITDPSLLRRIRTAADAAAKSGSSEAFENAVKQISVLRNQLAHSVPAEEPTAGPRPAYRLEDDDD